MQTSLRNSHDLSRRFTTAGSEPGGVAAAGAQTGEGSSPAPGPARVVTLSHRRDDPLSNTAPIANSGRVATLEGLAALRSDGTIADEEFAAEKTDVMSNST
jgi:hypothetical protein